MAKDQKIKGIDLYGDVVPLQTLSAEGKLASTPGVLYQVVEGDPTSTFFQETIQKGAREWAEETGNRKGGSR